MTKRIIVIGKTGQLARALAQQANLFKGQLTFYGRDACDLSASAADISAFANGLPQCDGLIIAAAYTDVDGAETHEDMALQVNAIAPDVFARFCAERSIPLVHISTDYVFSGDSHMPLKLDTQTDPINAYGRSKLAGEIAIEKSNARAAVLRTSWVFDARGKNFLTTMLGLGETRNHLTVVADQIGRPTYAGHLAQACMTVLNKLIENPQFQGGIYHVSASGEAISWAGFAKAIFAATEDTRGHDVKVTPIASSEYPTPAKRPSYSVLDISAFEQDFNRLPDWQSGLRAALIEWRKGL